MILMFASIITEHTGMIKIWFGSIATIPGGWRLCDGIDGTPDLRHRFVIGAGPSYLPDDTGGDITHAHSELLGCGVLAAGTDIGVTTDTRSNLPPYYALCYIMKL
ncbi:hypothetical protein LCGC14_1176810 [marine sediment metagenome]|uniref:Phage tail collar domain-containing protein n=1 Tax=marine sediment metagenome TaxID=412755 RepID=A0A0F9MB57_9ZZZZ